MNKLQRVFYKLSGHNAKRESREHEQAKRTILQTGIEIGERRVPTPVISHGTCPRHPIVLLNNKGHGDYSCMMCKDDERNTDRLPAQVYTQARRGGAGPHTAVHQTIKLSQDLLKGDINEQGNN